MSPAVGDKLCLWPLTAKSEKPSERQGISWEERMGIYWRRSVEKVRSNCERRIGSSTGMPNPGGNDGIKDFQA
jgi:hypothetical protein